MECEEGQPIEDADRGRPAPLSFWQRIGPRAVALLALVGPAAAVFLTQHWHSRPELIQDLKETQPAIGYAIETTKPAGATFAVYPGIIADKTAPASAPLRTGTAPGTAEELHGGNYTIFFHKMAKLRSRVFRTARKFFAALCPLGSRR